MLGRRGLLVALLALVLAAGVQATPAAAEGEPDTGAFGAFRLKGTNGYSILVLALSKPQFRNGEVLVIAARREASVLYLTRARVTPTTIDADLGPAGQISVRFEPSGPPERVHASCKRGESLVYEPGAWVGEIEITGEEGFTDAHRSRARAIPTPFLEAGCATVGIGETSGDGVVGAKLVARSATKKRAIYLQANKNHRSARVRVEASLEERRGGLIVSREVVGFFPTASFDFDPSLQSAALAPAAPFAGSASFHRDAGLANQWRGNLSVDFPGRANVPLAGHRFKSALVHAKRTEERHRFRLPRPNLLTSVTSLLPKRK
ncbi:MAG TPA: hypothetical protein VFS54_09345 [Solirubrobacterales bacterium]|nr:hypothetical protein [Solirubrobacterales bacterium]